MTEKKWTQGPWKYIAPGCAQAVNGLYIKLIGGSEQPYFSVDEQRANARLIAAAPDLYEACEGIVKALDLSDNPENTHGQRFVNNRLLGPVLAALAKARGETLARESEGK